MRFFKNSAAKVVKMYAAVRVSEKRDARAKSLFFRPFFCWVLFAKWPIFSAFSFLGASHKASHGLKFYYILGNICIYQMAGLRVVEIKQHIFTAPQLCHILFKRDWWTPNNLLGHSKIFNLCPRIWSRNHANIAFSLIPVLILHRIIWAPAMLYETPPKNRTPENWPVRE